KVRARPTVPAGLLGEGRLEADQHAVARALPAEERLLLAADEPDEAPAARTRAPDQRLRDEGDALDEGDQTPLVVALSRQPARVHDEGRVGEARPRAGAARAVPADEDRRAGHRAESGGRFDQVPLERVL